MGSLILQIASRCISPILVLISVIVFFRGHNHPGGGFIGGLIASIAFIVSCFADDPKAALQKLRVDPKLWMAAGLVTALVGSLIGVVSGKPFFTGKWVSFHLAVLGDQHLGTPTLFDLGIFILVIGTIATIVANLLEE